MAGTDVLGSLRDSAPERYLACLYLPETFRTAVAAIHCFDAKIAAISDMVSEPVPGEIRLQWWREVIGGEREHGGDPIAAALIGAIDRHDLPRAAFHNYLQAREFDLYQDPMPDREALEAYCGETSSAMLQSAALCAGAAPGRQLADAAGHGGVALGVCDILRRTARHRSQGRCYIPGDVLSATGLTAQEWLTAPDDRHAAALEAMTSLATEHYEIARKHVAGFEPEQRGIFLVLAVVPAYLRACRLAGMRTAYSPPQIGPIRQHWLFWRAATAGLRPV